MPIGRPPGQPPREPKRNYLDTMHRVMRGMGQVGKEIARGGPLPEERMRKLGKPLWFSRAGKRKWVIPTHHAESWVRSERSVDPQTRKILAEMVKIYGDPSRHRQWSPAQKGIGLEHIQSLRPWLEKEYGKQATEEMYKTVGLGKGMNPEHSIFKGGRQHRAEKILEHFDRAARTYIPKTKRPLFHVKVKSLHPSYEPLSRRGLTQEKAAELHEEIERTLGQKAAAGFRRALWAKEVPGSENAASPAPRSRWRFAPSTGWGKRPSPANPANIINFAEYKQRAAPKQSAPPQESQKSGDTDQRLAA